MTVQLKIQDFCKIINEFDPDLEIIFKELTTNTNFLYINLKIIYNKLHFDVYLKLTNSFSYLQYKICHPPHARNNIKVSLAICNLRIVTNDKHNLLQEFKDQTRENTQKK